MTLASRLLLSAMAALVFAAALPGVGLCQDSKKMRSYAVVIANNASADESMGSLRYADDDGARFLEMFGALTDQAYLLTTLDNETQILFDGLVDQANPPTHDELRRTFSAVGESIRKDRAGGLSTQLFVVFIGHGGVDDDGVGYLSLADGRLTRDELLEIVIKPQWADRTHLFIDACNAYYMVRARGDERSGRTYDDELEAFLEAKSTIARWPKLGVFLSTAGAAEVHEWDEYGGGVFSHQVRSGLLGAADVDGDFRVTYGELEAYLGAANAAVQNRKAKIHYYARPPRKVADEVLVDLSTLRKATFLEVPVGSSGRYDVEDSRGVRYADFNAAGDSATRVALLWDPVWRAPHYFVRSASSEARIAPDSSPGRIVEIKDLPFVARSDRARGTVSEAYRADLFATPYGKGFFAGYHAQAAREPAVEVVRLPSATKGVEQLAIDLGYFASPSLFGLDGVLHNVSAAASVWLSTLFALEVVAEYGTSGHQPSGRDESPFRLHRVSLGVGARAEWSLPAKLRLGTGVRLGHQWLVHDGDDIRADSLAVRMELAATVGFDLADDLVVSLRPGVGFDVLTVDGDETLEALPLLGLELSYRFGR